MRRQPRLVRIRIKALDERHLLRCLSAQVIPLQLFVVLYRERAAFAGGVDEANGDEVVLDVEGAPVRHGEGVVSDGCADGAPDVYDADAAFEEAGCVGGEVVVDACDGGVECLVDVHAVGGSADKWVGRVGIVGIVPPAKSQR